MTRAILLLLLIGCEGRLSYLEADTGPTLAFDAGTMTETDAGSVVMDAAGNDPTDAGSIEVDAGSIEVDAGPIEIDAGPIDAGPPPDTRPSSARHTQRPLGSSDAPQGYWEYLPPRYGDGNDHPLLVFLHGIGENGNGASELARVANNGPPRIIGRDQWPNERPFIVLSPQHPGGGCPGASEVHSFIAWAIAHYDVDPTRVYLTGLSCGAIGAFNYVGRYLDEQIAALVPIAGDGNGAWNAQGCELGRIAIWAFHGDADGVVGPSGSTTPMNNLIACPSRRDARLTMYPGVGHDSWSRTYDLSAGHDIYTWMLGFTHP
jgi:predicted esterase